MTEETTIAQPDSAQTFAEGDLGNVQKFLFGEPIIKLSEDIERLTNQLEATEKNLRREINELATTQRIDKNDRVIAAKHAQRLAQESEASLSAVVNELQLSSVAADEALKQQLESAVEQWTVSLDLTREDLLTKLIDAVKNLQDQKLDRRFMSDLLGSVSEQVDVSETAMNLPWLNIDSLKA
ncbi:MAG: hypothetical protein AB8B86_18730 [Pseudomonadales bacterium]